MTKIPKLKTLFLLFSVLYFLLSLLTASAAQLFFEPSVKEVGAGQQFQIDLKLDPQNQSVNATEAKIRFSRNLKLISLNDGNSLITLWLQKPTLKDGAVIFSGIVPGGYGGDLGPDWQGPRPGKILSLLFEAEKPGPAEVKIEDGKVLLNDSRGTPAPLTIPNFQINVNDVGRRYIPPEVKDAEPPEPFTPEIARDPNIFEGKYFLVFTAQDKGRGLDRYEISERREFKIFGINLRRPQRWTPAESPYLLKDQKLKSHIYVKAIDRAENERTVVLRPQKPLRWYEYPLIWIMLIIVLGIIAKYAI